MKSDATPPRVRCRQIEGADLSAIIALLRQGFASRSARYWSEGFERQTRRNLPPDTPRYGLMLESEGRPVGVILLLYADRVVNGEALIRCNLSSWYVEPAFRSHASMLVMRAMKSKSVTFVNISPAPHTVPTIEAQGFRRYANGLFVGVPVLRRGVPGAAIHRVSAARPDAPHLDLPERGLLLDHAGMGCLTFVVETSDGLHPFVFLPFRVRSGRLHPPAQQLVYCRDIADYLRFAGTLGRTLLRHGALLVVHDADASEPGFVGRFLNGIGPKFFRGPEKPKRGDMAYTERVIFGP